MKEEYAERHEKIVDALRRESPWFFLEGDRVGLDKICVIDGNYAMQAPAKFVGILLGWSMPLKPRRDDMIGLIGREPVMTLPFGSRIEAGNKNKMQSILMRDIFDAFRDSHAREVVNNNTVGWVRFVYEDGTLGARTYRETGSGILVFNVAGEGNVPVGPEVFYFFREPVDLASYFARAEARLQQSLKDRGELVQEELE